MIDIKEIEKLAELARLEVPQEEKVQLQKDLDSILAYVGQVNEAHAKAESGNSESFDLVKNAMREDGMPHESGAYSKELLAQAPATEKGFIKVKKIL